MPKLNSPRTGFVTADVTANKTLTAADSGIVQDVKANAVITLPATALGLTFPIHVNTTEKGKKPTVSIAPAAADGVTGAGFTAAVNKAINASSAEFGDTIVLRGTGAAGATAWIVDSIIGAWTRAA